MLDNLKVEIVSSPRKSWLDDLENMIEGYPFENHRDDFTGDMDIDQTKSTWHDENTNVSYFAAHFGDKLVGWIEISESQALSSTLENPYRIGRRELIQRNRDDVRSKLLDEINDHYSTGIIEIYQPAQNRTARNFLLKQPNIIAGRTINHLGLRNTDPDQIDASGQGFNVDTVSELPSRNKLSNLSSFIKKTEFLSSINRQNLYNSLLEDYVKNPQKFIIGMETKDLFSGLAGKISDNDYYNSSEDGTKLVIARAFGDVCDRKTLAALLKTFLKRLDDRLRQFSLEFRVSSSQSQLFDFLIDLNFTSLTKRMHFQLQPGSSNYDDDISNNQRTKPLQ